MRHPNRDDWQCTVVATDLRDLPVGNVERDVMLGYQHTVTAEFARHRRHTETRGCSCGGPWPCAAEEHAAWLLDWIVD